MNLLTAKQVAAKLSCAESFVWARIHKDPTFPKPLRIGENGRATRWIEGDLHEWLLTKQRKEVYDDDNTSPTPTKAR